MSSRAVQYGVVRLPRRVTVRTGVVGLLGAAVRWWWKGWVLWAGMVADANSWDAPERPWRDHGR